MILYSILLLLCLGSVSAKSVPKNGCDESKTHFFVMDNASLKSEDPIVYKATSEEECLKTCTQNRDKFDRPIVCNSFTYDHASFSCTIHKEKSAPVGSAEVETAVGKRYFEKTCLSQNLPEQCGQSQFIRVDQSVLVGYAVNMTLTDSIESCVTQCVQEADCKSAMYFYEDGECITNKESALTKQAGFMKEPNDKVIYFQNGCDLNAVKKAPVKSETAEVGADEVVETVEEEVKPVAHIQISETTPKPEGAVEKVEDMVEQKPMEKQEEPMEEKMEETNSETVEDGEYEDEEVSTEETVEEEVPTTVPTTTTEEPTTTTEEPTTEEPTPKRIKNLIQKKIKKHPKNFGSKTYEILKQQKTAKKPKLELPEESSLEFTDDSSKAEEPQEPEETYFSEWSDWTPCTKSNERQVRRRRCLNLRKCLGALMQVQNCPEIIPTTTPQNNEMIRSVVSVDGDEYDEPIAVDNISVDPIPSRLLPVLNEQLWGPWQGTCQQFASSQPCNNGSMIGFESRECIAKDPAQCEGPFFRYCTLTC